MHFLFKSGGKDVPMQGVDWIVLSANAVGIAIVTAATMHANAPTHQVADTASPTAIEVASLD